MSNWDEAPPLEEQSWQYFWRGMRMLWGLMGQQRQRMTKVLLSSVGLRALALLTPLIIKLIFDQMHNRPPEELLNSTVWWLLGALLLSKVVSLVVHHFYKELQFLRGAIALENWWPVQAQQKLLELSLGYHERENTGKKIAKINKGVDRLVEILAMLFWDFLPQLFYIVINLVVIMVLDWRIGLLFCLPFIPATWLNMHLYRRYYHRWQWWDQQKEVSQGMFCQALINVSTVQHCVQERRENGRLADVRDAMADVDKQIAYGIQWWFFATGSILQLSFVATVAVGLYFVSQGLSTVGTIVYVVTTGTVTIESLWGLVNVYNRIMRYLVSVERMQELLEEPVEVVNTAAAQAIPAGPGVVRFEQAAFRYPGKDKDVLHDFTLDIAPGTMTALVARSGAGKTTAVRLLCRMYDVTAGRITLDGVDIRQLDLWQYRSRIAIVQQDVEIFDGSFSDNVSYAWPTAPVELVNEALAAAHLSAMMADTQRFPDGLDTQVGERGVRLSGGERQRVGIARAYLALLNGARILILDEATSSLDSEAERAIQEMIDRLRQQRPDLAIVAIAHRLSTIQKADTICVMQDGQITERGSHAQLLKRNGLYAYLVGLQQLGELRE